MELGLRRSCVYSIMLELWKRHPLCVFLRAHLLYFLFLWDPQLALGGLLLPCQSPSPPPPEVLSGMCVPSQNLSLSFPFPCGVALPVISQAQPALWVWAVGPSLPSSFSGPSSTLSIPGWTSLFYCPFPGKGYLCWSRGWGWEPRRKPVPEAPLPSWSPQLTAGLECQSFLEILISKLVSGRNLTSTCGGR